ncbi:MAG: hypothetical protein M9938_11335 [Solirubrobacterales bacterium]|nr:hypothetical protein [Solirubrobacterales bacterium]
MIDLLWIALLGGLAAWFISSPFRGDTSSVVEDPEVAALEAARDAKYREIKDAEIDFRAGKLTRADFEQIDRDLRREAVGILNRLERAHGAEIRASKPTPKATS